ncbi:hypothetical protein PENSPDRAFT_618809 [Peniophora sp. CONT]|nr:hypothetical protein PENSPDRAFT_618809 [Peniophora sp. CONT]
MDDAFEEDDSENTPLNVSYAAPTPTHARARSTPQGTYNFEHEYEYDFPPPGSPPRPSSVALPNDIGNSNGVLPTDEPHIPRTDASSRRNFFRRTFGALLPTHYQPLPTQVNVPGRGGGLMNDGVFANVMAKPARQVQITGENGEIYMVPEDTQAEAPPSYAAASADAAPAYWETTVHAPPTLNLAGDMIIDDLPTGPFVTFIMTALVAWFFQFPGFLLAYLLHGTHAGRFGAQAGLALTLIQYGFGATMGRGINDSPYGEGEGELGTAPMPSEPVPTMPTDGTPVDTLPPAEDMLPPMYSAGHEWISFLLMTVGWFLLLTSIIGYVRVKRFELSIRAATRQGGGQYTPEEATRENALRRNLEEVFGISISAEERAQQEQQQQQAPAPAAISPERHAEIDAAEARLERDLRAAGLL